MPRAKRDFGTIRKRANGRYQAYYMGPDQGFHRAPSTFETKSDAEAWLAGERRLIQYDEWTPSRSRRAKVLRSTSEFGEYARLWLENRDLKPRTRYLYGRLLERFILPTFGQMSMRDITPPVVRVWHSQLELDHPTQRSHAYSLLRAILATAVADEIIDANPCRVRGAGSTSRARRVEPASLSELEVLVRTMPERYQALVLLAAWCGLRFGEVTELRRHDIDLNAEVVQVRRGVVRIAGEVTVGTPKSQAGIRGVAIPPHLIPALVDHLEQHVEPQPDALVFASVGNPTRVELANAIFEYIEIFYNRQRRHSSIGYRTPIEYELRSETTTVTA